MNEKTKKALAALPPYPKGFTFDYFRVWTRDEHYKEYIWEAEPQLDSYYGEGWSGLARDDNVRFILLREPDIYVYLRPMTPTELLTELPGG